MDEWRPRPWSDRQLDEDRATSLALLNETAGLDRDATTYSAAFGQSAEIIDELFARSDALLHLDAEAVGGRPDLLGVARFLVGPPLSQDNLDRLVGPGMGRVSVPTDVVEAALSLITPAIDPLRFPWVAARRSPTESELAAARLATLTLIATERARTLQRIAARRLELLAYQALEAGGLTLARGQAKPLPWALPPGTYCREARVAGTNCDVPAHVRAHEIAFLIECKGSSTQINGTKRLKSIKEAAATWRRSFGDQVLTVAVISGAFKLEDLRATQADGVYVVWEHDMAPLSELAARLVVS